MPKRYPLLLTLSLTLLLPTRLLACECLWQGSFTHAAANADLIVSVEVLEHKGNAMDLQIEQVLQGKTYVEVIRTWGDDGQTCRPGVAEFPPGTRWVMALHKISEVPTGGFNPSTPNISYGRVGDYYLSGCGAYWLSLGEGLVSGNLIDGPRWAYSDDNMSPVLLDLVAAYLDGNVTLDKLKTAAKPQPESRELLNDTKWFLRSQQ